MATEAPEAPRRLRLWTCLATKQRRRKRTILCDGCKDILAVRFAIRLTPDDGARRGRVCERCGAAQGPTETEGLTHER